MHGLFHSFFAIVRVALVGHCKLCLLFNSLYFLVYKMSKPWPQPLPRRSPGSFHASRSLRRPAPYPSNEDREDHKHALDRYEELEKLQTFPAVKFGSYPSKEKAKVSIPSNKVEGTPSERRKSLYQKFYKRVQEEWKPCDVVVLCVANPSADYSISLGQSLQERGLSVEMLYLHAESGLTRALQDIRADGSPLCILVEQTNIALRSCTVIIFAQSLKIHRNMPQDQAMDLIVTEYSQGLTAEEHPSKDPADIAAETSQMLDDYLEREKHMRHYVPSDVRRLFTFLAEGVHLHPDELDTLSEYVLSRQEQAGKLEGNGAVVLSAQLGKPPPLLPTPSSAQPLLSRSSSKFLPGSALRSPPPLMSKPSVASPPSHIDMGRGPLLDTPRYPRGPPRRIGTPLMAGGPRPSLLVRPGGPLLPRPRGPLL